jgi:uncharacterized protein (DUF1778 family)
VASSDDIVVRRAAEESHRDLSEFVRTAAVMEAERILADRTVFTLDTKSWNRFLETLDRPPHIPPGLRDLFSRPSVFE